MSVSEQNKLKREGMWAATSKAIGAGLPKPFGIHITPPHVPEAKHGTVGFNVYSAGF
jgi:hypothetical protein